MILGTKATCRSCEARIRWMKTPKGRSMPLDVESTPDGNVVLRDGLAVVLSGSIVPKPGEVRFTAHWATCPTANEHRKKAALPT